MNILEVNLALKKREIFVEDDFQDKKRRYKKVVKIRVGQAISEEKYKGMILEENEDETYEENFMVNYYEFLEKINYPVIYYIIQNHNLAKKYEILHRLEYLKSNN